MCNSCFDENKLQMTTAFTVNYKDCLIVIKNVPCLECEMCGEMTFTDEVSVKIEFLVSEVKKLKQEISIIDYFKVA